ncbi:MULTISPECIES: phage protein NinX family protein [Burkholderia cepacia complex]|uniref:phage protein NinX family protein n=1 Tax=Burkholderia cepacia complex TaxID=87882 RepID=UPI000665FE18|nr:MULTISPECIES: phage protein NinX family protein [Burkholderia cepacia complex]RQS84349.1 DUF2591 domain-containing protein [Burkholderia seminalis]
MNVFELEGALLDYWVAKAEGLTIDGIRRGEVIVGTTPHRLVYSPSTSWKVGGPIIERERIDVHYLAYEPPAWTANIGVPFPLIPAPTPLVAAMRAFVLSKFGEEVADEVSHV